MDSAHSRRDRGWLPIPFVAVLGLWLYRSWQPRAFDVLDFSEFLPLLNAGRGIWGRLSNLLDYYASVHGRFNALSYGALAVKWTWLGNHPLAWQLLRAAELGLAATLGYFLLRRLSAGRLGAVLGASLLLFSYAAALPWVRLTMGEPLGLICALGAALAAARLGDEGASWGTAIFAGLALAAAILAKEMLVIWVPAVMVIAAARGGQGRLASWRLDSGRRRMLATLLVSSLAASLAVVYVARHTAVAGYAATYGAAPLTLGRFFEIFQRQLLPWPITGRSDGSVMLIAAVLFLAVVYLGLRRGFADPAWRAHCIHIVGLGLGLPLLGALVYLPWPVYSPFYGYPFVFGAAFLVATAVTILGAQGRRAGVLAASAVALSLFLVVPEAVHLAGTAALQQEVMTSLARELPSARASARIVVAVAALPAQAWQGMGASLVRYATATTPGLELPPAEDLLCGDAARLLSGQGAPRVTLISLSTNCGRIPSATATIRKDFSFWQWQPLRFGHDSSQADLLIR